MKTIRFSLLALGCLIHSVNAVAQGSSWPFGFQKPICSTMPSAPSPVTIPTGNTCTKWPVVQNGAWHQGATWNGGTVPANNDIVCIPANVTVRVTNPTYSSVSSCPSNPTNSPQLFIFVCGNIDFNAGGKLHLGCNSAIQIFTGGGILAANGNSDLIQIGTKEVWRFNNTNLNGPWYINDGCGSTPQGCQGAGVLPFKLGMFRAVKKSSLLVELDWSTQYEQNSSHFEVQRSTGGENWSTIGNVTAKGFNNGVTSYQFKDASPENGTSLYRLKQVDIDGHFYYSDVVRVTNTAETEMKMFPNPVGNTAHIYLPVTTNGNRYELQIINSNGAIVKQLNTGIGNVLSLPANGMAPGTYLVRLLENGTTRQQTMFVKQ
jgi:hypothetical protein